MNASKTPQNKGENRVAKRKLYSPGAALSEDEGTYIFIPFFLVTFLVCLKVVIAN